MLLGSLEKSVEILKAGNFGKKGEETSKLTEFEISRIFLATSALISDGYTYEPLGVHEINICYKYRDKFDLIPIEKLLILRTMISNSHGTVPGWYWFREFKQDGLCILLRYIALNDNDRTVRQSAINFFTTTGLRPHKSRVKSSAFYNEILKDGSRRVRGAALQLIGKFGQIQDIDLIDPFLKEQTMDLYDEATKSKIEIILKENPNTAFSVLLTSEFIKDDVKYSYLKRAIANAEDSTLYDHIGNKDVRVREIVVGELLNRKRITNDLMQKLLEDPSSDIRQKACLAIIESGENIAPDRIRQISDQGSESKTALAALARGLGIGRVDVDELLLKLFLTYPLSKLLKEVDWYSLNGHIAYRAIAIKYYKEQSVAIESDMETLFERIREKAFNDRMKEIENSIENAIVEIENKLTLEKVESLKDQLRKQVTDETSKVVVKLRALDDFILRNFISAALAGIILNGGPESIRFGRLFINHDDSSIKLQALKIVERFGDETDVKSAIDITNYSSGEIKLTAARVALNFSSDYQQAVMPLLQTKDTELIKQAVKHIWNDEVKRVRPVLKTLLYDKEDKTREIALSFFINRFGHKELEKMLSKYLERTTYYYNVVHSLDKAMYSPRAVRSYFLKSLKNY
jgi:HEAT repeat protein